MRIPFTLFALALSATALQAQTTWTDGAQDTFWTTSANWSAGVPTTTSVVTIGTQPTEDVIDVNTDGNPTVVAGFIFAATLTNSVDVAADFSETLQVNGAITNNDNNEHVFSLPVFAGANATYAGGSAGLSFDTLIVGTNLISTTGTINIFTQLSFNLNSTSAYGRIGAVVVDGAAIQINVGPGYVAHSGDTFDFAPTAFSNAFTGATFDPATLPALGGGMSWDTSNLLSQGTLTVVPEPATWGLFIVGLFSLLIFRRARSQALRSCPIRARR